MAHLSIIVENTEEDIKQYALRKENKYLRCPRKTCHHKWKTTVGKMIDEPFCPKCGGSC